MSLWTSLFLKTIAHILQGSAMYFEEKKQLNVNLNYLLFLLFHFSVAHAAARMKKMHRIPHKIHIRPFLSLVCCTTQKICEDPQEINTGGGGLPVCNLEIRTPKCLKGPLLKNRNPSKIFLIVNPLSFTTLTVLTHTTDPDGTPN